MNADDEFRRKFARYAELIETANSHFNLTGVTGWERVRDELFIRSFKFLSPVAGGYISAVEWFSGRRVMDVGTGAGIPGLVLKLAVPDMSLTLLDSSQKKTAFVRDVVADLGLENVDVVTGRAEEVGRDQKYRESFDLVVSRGVAKLVELAELTLPFASLGGAVVCAKGPNVAEEVAEAEWAAELLGAAPAVVSGAAGEPEQNSGESLDVNGITTDTMIYWMKIGQTPEVYPRRNGVPHSKPLFRGSIHTDRPKAGRKPWARTR